MVAKEKNLDKNNVFEGCDAKQKDDLDKVVLEYDILFQEPKGMPPKREIVHDIHLQQDAPLPNIGMYRLSALENAEIKKKVTAKQTPKLFFQHVWVHFGLPTSIVSDQYSRFVGSFWSSLWELMDTKLKKSTTFHPQIDGQTKVVNKTMIQLLKGYCSKHPKLWDEHLCYVQHGYNRAKHSYTQISPFETCFRFTLKFPLDFVFGKDIAVDGHSDADKATKFIEQIQEIH
eukprot:PITA_19058